MRSDSAPCWLCPRTDTETRYRLAWPSASHRRRGSSAARYITRLETRLQSASGLGLRKNAQSHKPGRQNLRPSQRFPPKPAPAACDPGEIDDALGAGNNMRPDTNAL